MKKKVIFVLMLLTSFHLAFSQNTGIGTNNPVTKLDVQGSFKSQAGYITASQPPTASQTYTMVNGNTLSLSTVDSIARVFDPGGSSGNYLPNLISNFYVTGDFTASGVLELLIENIELATGDSLIIYDGGNASEPLLLRLGNGYSASDVVINFSANEGYCVFKSNNDAAVAAGFSLLFKRKFLNTTVPDQITTGNALSFYPVKGALRGGFINAGSIGLNSIAFGKEVTASGEASFAGGFRTIASGFNSTAFGYVTNASGVFYATALGSGTVASGYSSATAMGNATVASGSYSTAMGGNTVASANYSTAMGNGTEASGTNAVAMGLNTVASGNSATAIGNATVASGSYSLAIGQGTRAKAYTLAMGRYNTISTHSETAWDEGEIAFIIGDGTSSTLRSNAFYIYKNGDTWLQGTLTQNSDARLKTNIHPLGSALDKIKKINGYTYYWKDSIAQPGIHTGVLAQEVQQVIPELVTTNTEGQLAVNYNGLIPYLIESVKLLEQQNARLEQKLNDCRKRTKKRSKRL